MPMSMPEKMLPFWLSIRRETDGVAVPGAGLRFFTTRVTLTVPFGRLAAGVNVTDCPVRSALAIVSMPAVSRVLFVSSSSCTAPPASAMTRIL